MPKPKTNHCVKKRLKITSTGKLLRTNGLKSHLWRKKATPAKQKFDKMLPVSPQDRQRILRALPYGL